MYSNRASMTVCLSYKVYYYKQVAVAVQRGKACSHGAWHSQAGTRASSRLGSTNFGCMHICIDLGSCGHFAILAIIFIKLL